MVEANVGARNGVIHSIDRVGGRGVSQRLAGTVPNICNQAGQDEHLEIIYISMAGVGVDLSESLIRVPCKYIAELKTKVSQNTCISLSHPVYRTL